MPPQAAKVGPPDCGSALSSRNWAEPAWVLYAVFRRLIMVSRSILAISAFRSEVSRRDRMNRP
jgi:hypothetical protein